MFSRHVGDFVLKTLISTELRLPETYVNGIVRTASHHYKIINLPKRKGGMRTIFHPSKQLKALQRWLLRRILSTLPVHSAACAYIKGRSTRYCAELHVGSKYLLRLDFASFFPSLKESDIVEHLKAHRSRFPAGWADQDDVEVSQLVTCNGELPIGAVTSPSISNSLCFNLDTQISALASMHRVTYTRYADDLFFSTDQKAILTPFPAEIQKIISGISRPKLTLNAAKTWHSSMKRRRTVTGLVLTSDHKISLGRARKRHLKSLIHRHDRLSLDEKRELAGWLAHAKSVEPEFLNRLYLKFGATKVDAARKG